MKSMKYDFKFFFRRQRPTAFLNPESVISDGGYLVVCPRLAEGGRIEEAADFFFGRSDGFLVPREEHGFDEGSASGDDNLCAAVFQADLGKQGRYEKGTVGVGEPSTWRRVSKAGAKEATFRTKASRPSGPYFRSR